jgi:hypothetical protein
MQPEPHVCKMLYKNSCDAAAIKSEFSIQSENLGGFLFMCICGRMGLVGKRLVLMMRNST